MSLTVSVEGDSHRIRFSWEEAAAIWADAVGPPARSAIRAVAPVSKNMDPRAPKPGTLRDSVAFRKEPSAGRMWVVLYATAPYTKFVIGGTKPHDITPHNRPRGGWVGATNSGGGPGSHALHWVDSSGDRFSQLVHHPGTKPNDFAARAVTGLSPWLARRFAEAVQEAIHT